VYYQNRRTSILIETRSLSLKEEFFVTGFPEPIIRIYCPKDDFVQSIDKEVFEYVFKGEKIAELEKIQEEYAYRKAQAEYAKSLLHDGYALQQEKETAVRLALNEWENTSIMSPLDGFIIKSTAIEKTYVNKGDELFALVPKTFRFLLPIDKSLQTHLEQIDTLTLTIQRLGITILVSETVYVSYQNQLCLSIDGARFVEIIPMSEELCVLALEYLIPDIAWVPVSFIEGNKVRLENGNWQPIEVIPTEGTEYMNTEGVVPVKGLLTGQKITGKR
jgi:multidrug efflux pump subunit AcrA (membrane-fusion protein)